MVRAGVLVFLAVSSHLLGAQGQLTPVTYSGYLSDYLCYDKCTDATSFSSCDGCALDGTNVVLRPQEHTVHCIRDVGVCIDSEYYLAYNVGTGAAPEYRPRFKLDAGGNARALEIIKATQKMEGLQVVATGMDDGAGTLLEATFTECVGNCDGVCTGASCANWQPPQREVPVSHAAVRAHGACMLTAWAFLAPGAALLKRHQPRLPGFLRDPKVGGFPLPFVLHAACMMLAVLLTVVGGVLAIAGFDRRATFGHLPIGFTVLALTIWQPLPAIFCRPEHDSPRRKYFNWIHRGGGALCLLLGAVNCFLGVMNYRTLWNMCGVIGWLIAACIGVVGWLIAAIVSEIWVRLSQAKDASTSSSSGGESGSDSGEGSSGSSST